MLLLSLKMWIHHYIGTYLHSEGKQSDALAMKNCIHVHQAKAFYAFLEMWIYRYIETVHILKENIAMPWL